MRRRTVVLILIAAPVGFVMTALFYGFLHSLIPTQPQAPATVARPLPAFDLPGLTAGAQGLNSADLAGEVTVVNLFASWCVPCLAEHPFINSLSQERGLTVVGIAWMDAPAATVAWLDEHGNPYARIGRDQTGALQRALDVKGVPTTYIVDADGMIRFERQGPLVGDVAVAAFEAALAELGR